MDANKTMKICILLLCLCFYAGVEKSCKSKAQHSRPENNLTNVGTATNGSQTQEPKYEILDVGCTPDEKCVVIAYCDAALFNREDMEKIAEKLSIEFEKKKVVNVNLFDKKDLARAYTKGIPSPRELQYDRRGWYLRTDDREFLLFFPDPARRGKQISIKLKKRQN